MLNREILRVIDKIEYLRDDQWFDNKTTDFIFYCEIPKSITEGTTHYIATFNCPKFGEHYRVTFIEDCDLNNKYNNYNEIQLNNSKDIVSDLKKELNI